MFSFVYEYDRPDGIKLRYIPVNEVHNCYFKVCTDKLCPLLSTLHLHPLGMKGCSLETEETVICKRKNCPVIKPHVMHPRCVNKRWSDPLPDFIDDHKTKQRPKFVYHFRAGDFKDGVHKIKRFYNHTKHPYYDPKPPKNMTYTKK